jgi:hypothetical protein
MRQPRPAVDDSVEVPPVCYEEFGLENPQPRQLIEIFGILLLLDKPIDFSYKGPMDPISNPYTPGAGSRPPALTGRDAEINAFRILLAMCRLSEYAAVDE